MASIQGFLIASTCFLYLVAAGLFSRAVWDFEINKVFIRSSPKWWFYIDIVVVERHHRRRRSGSWVRRRLIRYPQKCMARQRECRPHTALCVFLNFFVDNYSSAVMRKLLVVAAGASSILFLAGRTRPPTVPSSHITCIGLSSCVPSYPCDTTRSMAIGHSSSVAVQSRMTLRRVTAAAAMRMWHRTPRRWVVLMALLQRSAALKADQPGEFVDDLI